MEIIPAASDRTYNYIGSYIVQDEKLYYTLFTSSCNSDYSKCTYTNDLKTVSLLDPENISLKSSVALKNYSTGVMKIISNRLFITSFDYVSGLLVYKLTDPFNPVFEGFYRTDGWTSAENVSSVDNLAFVTAGPYGVQVIQLR